MCCVLQWVLPLPSPAVPAIENTLLTPRENGRTGEQPRNWVQDYDPISQDWVLPEQQCMSQSTRVGRAPFHMMCEDRQLAWQSVVCKLKKHQPSHLKSLRGNYQLYLHCHVTCSDAGTTTCHYPGGEPTGQENDFQHQALLHWENRSHTQSTHYKPHLSGQNKLENTSKTPRMEKFLLEVMNGNHVGFETVCSCPDQTIRGSRPGRGLSLPRLWSGQQSLEIHPMF